MAAKAKKEKGLNPRRKAFVAAYTGPALGNASEAARMAGYSEQTAGAQGHFLLKNPEVVSAVQHRLERIEGVMTREEVLRRLSRHAEADIGAFIEVPEEGTFQFDLKKAKELGLTYLIKKLKHDPETGAPVVEMVDSQAALDKLAKVYRCYDDEDKSKAPQVNVAILNLPPHLVKEVGKALLSQGVIEGEVVKGGE